MSNTIRRASQETQVLKASDFQIKGDNGEDVEPLLLCHFERYIGDRFPKISKTISQRLARAMLLQRKRIIHRRDRQRNAAIWPHKTVPNISITLPAAQPAAPSQIQSASLAPEKFKRALNSPSAISESKTIALDSHETLVFPPAPGLASKRRYEQLKRQRITEFAGLDATSSDVKSKLNELLESDLQSLKEMTCPYGHYALPAQEMFDEGKRQ